MASHLPRHCRRQKEKSRQHALSELYKKWERVKGPDVIIRCSEKAASYSHALDSIRFSQRCGPVSNNRTVPSVYSGGGRTGHYWPVLRWLEKKLGKGTRMLQKPLKLPMCSMSTFYLEAPSHQTKLRQCVHSDALVDSRSREEADSNQRELVS